MPTYEECMAAFGEVLADEQMRILFSPLKDAAMVSIDQQSVRSYQECWDRLYAMRREAFMGAGIGDGPELHDYIVSGDRGCWPGSL